MSPQDSNSPGAPFVEWLKQLPTGFKLLVAAASAIGGVLAPERLIPVPLSDYDWIATLVILLGVALVWGWQAQLARHVRAVGVAAGILLLVMIALNIRYVRSVDYQNPPETVSYLIGETLTDPGLCGSSPQVIIQQCGGDWDALEAAWGTSFQAVIMTYALAYVLFVTCFVLCLGTLMLPSVKPSEPSAGSSLDSALRREFPPGIG